jgi:hypothetical protein
LRIETLPGFAIGDPARRLKKEPRTPVFVDVAALAAKKRVLDRAKILKEEAGAQCAGAYQGRQGGRAARGRKALNRGLSHKRRARPAGRRALSLREALLQRDRRAPPHRQPLHAAARHRADRRITWLDRCAGWGRTCNFSEAVLSIWKVRDPKRDGLGRSSSRPAARSASAL